jgi:transposase
MKKHMLKYIAFWFQPLQMPSHCVLGASSRPSGRCRDRGPYLSMPKRGPKCKLGYHRVFNLILWVLYTGMQWKCLPIPQDAQGKPAIHYTTIYKVFAKWADDGSLWQAFVASVRHLAAEKQLDLTVLHGDGTNTVAKQGAMGLATRATNIRRARKLLPSSTIMATSSRLSLWLLSMRPT